MRKLFRYLIFIEAVLLFLVILILLATRNSDDYSGLIAIYPLIAAGVLGVVILVLGFIYAAKKSVNISSSSSNHQSRLGVIIFTLIGVPALGIYYASIGSNRERLAVISKIVLVIGVGLSFWAVYRFSKLKK